MAAALMVLVTVPMSAMAILPMAESSPVVGNRTIGEVDDDIAAYESALETWKATYAATEDRAEKRALRKAHPASVFTEKLRAHFEAGELKAAVWCLENIKALDMKRKDREALRLALYDALIVDSDPARRAWTLETMMKDSALARAVNFTGLEQRVVRFLENESNSDARGLAIFKLTSKYMGSRDETESTWATGNIENLLSFEPNYKGHALTLTAEIREKAEKFLFAAQHLVVGKIAPDFTGSTIDGVPVALADTRGKVTVLDFFGFW